MNEVAQACGLSKATLYHYYATSTRCWCRIADGHVSRLHALVAEVRAPSAWRPKRSCAS